MNLYLIMYIYSYTLSFTGILEEFQRKIYLERKRYFVKKERLYQRSSYGPLCIPKITERPSSTKKSCMIVIAILLIILLTKQAKTLYYWPNMYQDIKDKIKYCSEYQICDKLKGAPLSL